MSHNMELESFMDEAIRRFMARGYNPHIFIRMRGQHGTVEAMKRLVLSHRIQSGLSNP